MNVYTIHVAGQLDERWSVWLEGWQIAPHPDGGSTLTGAVRDQAELHGVLNRVFGLNLELVGVVRENPHPTTSLDEG